MRTIHAGHRAFVVVCLFALLGQTLQGIVTAQSPSPTQDSELAVVSTVASAEESLPPAESIPSPSFLQSLPEANPQLTEPVIKPASPVVVSIVFDDKRIKSGQKINAALTLTAITTTYNISVDLAIPAGLEYETNSSKFAVYNTANRTLEWQNLTAYASKKAEDDIKFTVSAPDAVAGLVLTPSVTSTAKSCCDVIPAQLLIGKEGSAQSIDSKGGNKQLTSRIKLEFSAGAVKQKADVKATEYTEDNDDIESFFPFDLGPDMSFDAPVTATIDLSGAIPAGLLARGFVPALYYAKPSVITETVTTIDGKSKDKPRKRLVLETVPSSFDPYKQTVTALLQHFSDYGFGSIFRIGQPEPWKLNPSLGNVGLFRGSMNYNFPLPSIKLPDGLGADLALSYSSAAADEGGMDATRTGKGWSMDVPSIRRGNTTMDRFLTLRGISKSEPRKMITS